MCDEDAKGRQQCFSPMLTRTMALRLSFAAPAQPVWTSDRCSSVDMCGLMAASKPAVTMRQPLSCRLRSFACSLHTPHSAARVRELGCLQILPSLA